MTVEFNVERTAKHYRFNKLGMWYILALSVVATIAIVGQVLIQRHLQSQENDSRVVNLAGTQRYRSQEIVKLALLVYAGIDHRHVAHEGAALQQHVAEWKERYVALQRGNATLNLPGHNSAAVQAMFKDLDPYVENMATSVTNLLRHKQQPADTALLRQDLQTLLDNETVFLSKMDHIVFRYDQEAREKVSTLSKLEFILLAITIVVILLEIFFVFRPTTLQVARTIQQLRASEKNARKLSKEIGALYSSLEKSYEQISIVNQPVDNPRLFAKADKGGNLTFIGEAFMPLSGIRHVAPGMRLSDLFAGMNNADDWMDEVIDVVSDGGTWQGQLQFNGNGNTTRWVSVMITPIYHGTDDIEELVMMGADITKRKTAEQNMGIKNRAEIEKKINQQKFRSVLILEGQEEERKRLAMDIHDGIGQMLTSLKYQIEAIDTRDVDKASQKIREADQLIKDVIKEVRRVTFNLKPTVLGDYGLQAAVNVFVQEVGKLTDINIRFEATGQLERLPQKTENNIFRIIQEAINNAIKYSEAKEIVVTMRHNGSDLVITVSDRGKGFDSKLVDARNMNIESGRGFFNMYERTEYVNGTLTIDAAPGEGTTVTLNVPIRSAVTIDE